MIDLNYLYQSFCSTYNTFQGGFFRPQTDFQQKVNDISKQLWIQWTREAEKSQEARDNLAPFLKSKNVIVASAASYGVLKLPADYGRFASARILVSQTKTYPDKNVEDGKCDGMESQAEATEKYYDSLVERNVELIDNQRWGDCLTHLTKGPTLDKPKMTQIDKQFKVAPRTVSVVVLDYYVEPKEATFKYTIAPGDIQTGAGDYIIYNKTESQPLEWPANIINQFVDRLGEAYGLFTRDAFVSNVSTNQTIAEK